VQRRAEADFDGRQAAVMAIHPARIGLCIESGTAFACAFGNSLNMSRCDAAPLIAFIATKAADYVTETDGYILACCSNPLGKVKIEA